MKGSWPPVAALALLSCQAAEPRGEGGVVAFLHTLSDPELAADPKFGDPFAGRSP